MWEIYAERRFDGKTLMQWLQKSSSTEIGAPETWGYYDLYVNVMVLSVCFMGSIVYGDIIPFTIAEQTAAIIEMIIGRAFISFLFAEMSSYVRQQYSAFDNHTRHYSIVNKWMQLNGIS